MENITRRRLRDIAAVFTILSAFAILIGPVPGIVGVVVFGGAFLVLRQIAPPRADRAPRMAELARSEMGRPVTTNESAERLVIALGQVEEATEDRAYEPDGIARRTLRDLVGNSRTLTGLQDFARNRAYWRELPAPFADAAARLADGTAGPIAIALASVHPDGRVREAAVARMRHRPLAEYAALLALRCDDWVEPIRKQAYAAVADLLDEDPAAFLPSVIPIAVRLSERRRGGVLLARARAAVGSSSRDVWLTLLHSSDRSVSRLAYDVGADNAWFTAVDLDRLATGHPDPAIRLRAAQLQVHDAVVRGDRAYLAELASSRRAGIRATALAALVRIGELDGPASHLADPAPTVRAIAREAARRNDIDVLAAYRELVASDPSPATITDLAEVGGPAESPRITPLLKDARPPVRAAALTALAHLGSLPSTIAIGLLDDPDGHVVAAAARALDTVAVPAEISERLLADGDPARRRAGYRLRVADFRRRNGSTAGFLATALIAVVDEDPHLAARGHQDVCTLVRRRRDLTRGGRGIGTASDDLVGLAAAATPRLSPGAATGLANWLAGS